MTLPLRRSRSSPASAISKFNSSPGRARINSPAASRPSGSSPAARTVSSNEITLLTVYSWSSLLPELRHYLFSKPADGFAVIGRCRHNYEMGHACIDQPPDPILDLLGRSHQQSRAYLLRRSAKPFGNPAYRLVAFCCRPRDSRRTRPRDLDFVYVAADSLAMFL